MNSQPVEQKIYAGFWVRLVAGFFDVVLLFPLFAILIFSFGFSFDNLLAVTEFNQNNFQKFYFSQASSNGFMTDLTTYSLSIAYVVFFLSGKSQATIGKRLMGIYVGNVDGSKLSPIKAVCRALASILTSFTAGIGFVIVIFTKEKISLHDFICKTRVFHGKKS